MNVENFLTCDHVSPYLFFSEPLFVTQKGFALSTFLRASIIIYGIGSLTTIFPDWMFNKHTTLKLLYPNLKVSTVRFSIAVPLESLYSLIFGLRPRLHSSNNYWNDLEDKFFCKIPESVHRAHSCVNVYFG